MIKIKSQTSIMKTASILIALMSSLRTADAGNVQPCANALEFGALCQLVALAESEPTLPVDSDKGKQAFEDIQALNMTLSSQEWQAKFSKGGDGKTWETKFPDGMSDPDGWADAWPRWLKAIQDAKTPTKADEIKQHGFEALSKQLKTVALARIRTLASVALKLQSARTQLEQTLNKPGPSSLTETLETAVFGKTGKTRATVAHSDAFGSGAATNYAGYCQDALPTTKATSVAATLACLCVKADSNNQDEACGHGMAATQWTVSGVPTAAQITSVLAYCSKTEKATISATDIKGPLDTLQRSIRIISGSGYLGAYNTGSCGGQSNNGLCVKYAAYTGTGATGFKQITWAGKLRQLQHQLQAREDALKAAEVIDKQLKATREAAYAVANEVEILYAASGPVETTTATGTLKTNPDQKCVTITEQQQCRQAA
uniref:Variant surface glycoprotein 1125.1282 n=1 Tax=Trypanosoma brucei TaxID=5691 RepID=A0A1J0R6U7_9TRYP|nr:variant surface glycoprotein 1125.1282 [Trypanosoma brucei]